MKGDWGSYGSLLERPPAKPHCWEERPSPSQPELKKIQLACADTRIPSKTWTEVETVWCWKTPCRCINLMLIFCLCLNPPNASPDSSGYDSPREGINIFSQNSTNLSQSMERLKNPVYISQRCCSCCFSRSKSLLMPLGNRLHSQKRRQPAIAWDHPTLPRLSYIIKVQTAKVSLCILMPNCW